MITTTPGDPLLHPGTTQKQVNNEALCEACHKPLWGTYEMAMDIHDECAEAMDDAEGFER
jgi:hypothetical protein